MGGEGGRGGYGSCSCSRRPLLFVLVVCLVGGDIEDSGGLRL